MNITTVDISFENSGNVRAFIFMKDGEYISTVCPPGELRHRLPAEAFAAVSARVNSLALVLGDTVAEGMALAR